ncbi:MAG TPA: DUF2090 domain-containing protein [Vicinamibacterales bacterium]|nr:DUF2090 domain-containing protein [Vicinamibacterales bacterium]
MNLSRIYMLASDHRWQWEEWCAGAGVPAPRIAEAKQLVFAGFTRARDRSDDVRRHGALLLDSTYGGRAVAAARSAGIPVGTPVERAGRFPLEWQDDPFHAGLEGDSFAKVLVRYRPEWTQAAKDAQLARLLELQAWCRREGMPLLLEIIIMRQDEDERDFEERGRPALLASVIRDAYSRGLVPDLWKIEGTSSASGASVIDAAIRERNRPRQLILGKGADTAIIEGWFAAAAALPSTAGFAVGRSVFWGPCTAFLQGRQEPAAAVEEIAGNYLGLIAMWQRFAAPAATRSGERA